MELSLVSSFLLLVAFCPSIHSRPGGFGHDYDERDAMFIENVVNSTLHEVAQDDPEMEGMFGKVLEVLHAMLEVVRERMRNVRSTDMLDAAETKELLDRVLHEQKEVITMKVAKFMAEEDLPPVMPSDPFAY